LKWVDVFGPPGAGKSTICDPLWGHREIGWDFKLPPAAWQPFLDEVTSLFLTIRRRSRGWRTYRTGTRTYRLVSYNVASASAGASIRRAAISI
jgi:hypothetical protein